MSGGDAAAASSTPQAVQDSAEMHGFTGEAIGHFDADEGIHRLVGRAGE